MVKSDQKKVAITLLFAAALMAAPALCSAQTLINGAGATFPYPIYSKWFNEYKKLHPDIQINYQSIGSGGGIRQVTEGTAVERCDRTWWCCERGRRWWQHEPQSPTIVVSEPTGMTLC